MLRERIDCRRSGVAWRRGAFVQFTLNQYRTTGGVASARVACDRQASAQSTLNHDTTTAYSHVDGGDMRILMWPISRIAFALVLVLCLGYPTGCCRARLDLSRLDRPVILNNNAFLGGGLSSFTGTPGTTHSVELGDSVSFIAGEISHTTPDYPLADRFIARLFSRDKTQSFGDMSIAVTGGDINFFPLPFGGGWGKVILKGRIITWRRNADAQELSPRPTDQR